MPYISKEKREALKSRLSIIATPGELNYLITELLIKYMQTREARGFQRDYQTMNDILGALEGAKLEFYRRIVVKYEDEVKEKNGDVYEK